MKEKALKIFKRIPDGKGYVEIITATLTIPVLLTVLLLNYSNLNKEQTPSISPKTESAKEVVYVPEKVLGNNDKTILSVSPSPEITNNDCRKDIGPVEISFPKDNQVVDENPVSFVIDYSDTNYCSVVWSYRINGGSWSNFTSNNPVVYNIPNGSVKFDLKIQSTVIQKEESLSRSFIFKGLNSPNSATSSAN